MTAVPSSSAEEIIERLGLAPHPEGGWYRETFRDSRLDADGRSASTAIYFLLKDAEASHWHSVDATEFWIYHAGAPLALSVSVDMSHIVTSTLGVDLAAGEQPQAVVPAHAWQSARSLGAWTLVTCVVAPGFEFAGFTLAPPGWRPASST